jgi:benzil reductase ((S)-benzoin forming)
MTASVILTGTSSGLGAALFDAYLDRGVRVCALARRFTASQRRRAAAEPARIVLYQVDLADAATLPGPATIAALLAPVPSGEPVLLVHNAAVVTPIGLIGSLDPQEVSAAVQVNILAPLLLTNAYLAGLPAHIGARRVVYLTTGAIAHPYAGWATYCATKAAADMFIRCAATSTDDRATVHVLDPGAMDTGMHARLRQQGPGLPGHDRLVSRHTDGDLADPAAVARSIVAQTLPPGACAQSAASEVTAGCP